MMGNEDMALGKLERRTKLTNSEKQTFFNSVVSDVPYVGFFGIVF